MKKLIPVSIKKYCIISIGFLFLIMTFSGCVQEDIVLDAVEIRDYNGEQLSSILDFKENSIAGPQYIDKQNYTLTISGLVENPTAYTYDELLTVFQPYKKVITLHCVEGWSVTILWDGILVQDILDASDPFDHADTVIFHAYDGYTTSLPRDYITNRSILLAFKMNNVTLPPERGWPFQLVAESKWGYKWIKWIAEIELSDNSHYEGYWERRGYSNTANLNETFFQD